MRRTCFASISHSFPPAALLLPCPLPNLILFSFPDLTSPSVPLQALSQPPPCSWTCYPATLFSCLSTFYPCSFLASIVPTQTPPPKHLSPVASDHFSCTPSSRYLGSTGGEQVSMLVAGVPGAKAAWERKSHSDPGALGKSVLTHSVGIVNHANTDKSKACEREGCCLSSAKKTGQKHSTQMLNASLSALWANCDFLCG